MTQTITKAVREASIQTAVTVAKQALADQTGTAEKLRWKTSELVLPVATVDLEVVLLNPHSHRIKSQLQSLPLADQDVVTTDPYGTQAQEIITQLLRETPGFERIKSAVGNDGQLDAGVITTGGVLVNANTRAVALRDLRQKYIKVLVLPADAGPKEITELELRLQMEKDVKQEYSFTGQLLFIEDLVIGGNYTTAEVGRAIKPELTTNARDNKAATDFIESELRLLGLIREIISASGGVQNFLDFDNGRQALIEIDTDYQRLKRTKPDEATRVRDAQLAGMIAGVDYRRLREIDSSLLDTYVAPALRESPTLAPHIDILLSSDIAPNSGETPTGVSDFFGDDEDVASPVTDSESLTKPSLTGLYTLLAQTKPDANISIPTSSGDTVTLPRTVVAGELFSGLSTAIENKKRDSRQTDDLTAPMAHLKEAARLLDKAATAYVDVQDRPSFDRNTFEEVVREYRRAASAFDDITSTAEGSSV